MKLTKVEIKNFRSIADATISFEEFSCRILIGKNETGKSNVLKAISTLSPSYNPADGKAKYDKRMKGVEPDKTSEEAVIFYFDLEAADTENLYDKLRPYLLCKDLAVEKIFKTKAAKLSLTELLLTNYQLVRRVDLKDKKVSINLQNKKKSTHSFCNDWLRIPDEQTLIVTYGTSSRKNHYKYSNILDKPENGPDFAKASFEECDTLIKNTVKNNLLEWSFPEVIYWKNEEDQNLRAEINIRAFKGNPNSYHHFKSMCLLCRDLFPDEESIKIRFQEAMENNNLAYLYENIQEKVTSYLNDMWGDFKNEEIKIDTSQGNENIRLSVRRKKKGKKYGISISSDARSDGCKKFLKLLLNLSLKTHNKESGKKIILIDEAEIYLHPSSAEYFRDELIALGKEENIINQKNIVVFSTHSPFMIDPNEEQILRHIITEKKHEQTKLKSPLKGKIYHEELLWRSIGCGILRSLPKLSILFEGYCDWKLFKTATHKDSPLEGTEAFSHEINDGKIATANASGVGDFQHLAPLFQAAKSDLFILCDSDKAGKESKKSFVEKKLHGSQNMYTFSDLQGGNGQTSEDYIEIGFVQKVFNEYCMKEELEFSQKQQEGPENCLNVNKPVLAQIECLLNKMTKKVGDVEEKKPVKEMKNELKELIFKDLKAKDIKQKNYASVLSNLYDKINQFRKEQEDTT